VAAGGGSVGASGAARKPLALLGLGLTAALRVRFPRSVAPVCALSATRSALARANGGPNEPLDRHRACHQGPEAAGDQRRDRDLHAAERCQARRQAGPGRYFDVKCFDGQACSCYLKAGREVAIDLRLVFDEFQTQDGGYASRVYLVAERVEFLATRSSRSTGQAA
jgi:hypothetical protein